MKSFSKRLMVWGVAASALGLVFMAWTNPSVVINLSQFVLSCF
jgi:hypothetical protein